LQEQFAANEFKAEGLECGLVFRSAEYWIGKADGEEKTHKERSTE